MYCYIYDEFVQDKKFERELLKIENRLTDLDIAGKVLRLALFRNAEEMIRDEVRRGVSTVIAVGNDKTVRKVLDAVADSGVTFGLIPLGPDNSLAKLLGVPEGVAACDVLSARRVESIDVGTVNGRRFITGVSCPDFRAELTCEGKFRIAPKQKGDLEIRNLCAHESSDPCDGYLEAVLRVDNSRGLFRKKRIGKSVLPAQNLAIRSEKPMAIYADGEEMTGTRFDIGIEPNVLRIITGRERLF